MPTSSDSPLSALLQAAGLTIDTDLDGETLDSLAARDRASLLTALKERGIGLKERQALANAVARYKRALMNATSDSVPQSIVVAAPASADALPLLVSADGGLCNKLRVVLSYRRVARARGRTLEVLWVQSDHCPGRFDELFEPVAGVAFAHDAVELSAACQAAFWQRSLPVSMLGACFACHPSVRGTDAEVEMWRELRPLPAIAQAVAAKLALLTEGGKEFVAVHIRRTDMDAHLGPNRITHDTEYARFIGAHLGANVYIATDNATTQRKFLQQCGARAVAHTPISPDVRARRHTPLNEAVADIFVCAAAAVFKGCCGSSFSDTIDQLRRLAERDEHMLEYTPCRTVGQDGRHRECQLVDLLDFPVQSPT